jgi:uncharacterized membrane protein YkoI
MKKRWLTVVFVGLGLMGCASMEHHGEDKDNDDNEVKITLDQAPAPVQATLQAQTSGGRITDLDKETDDGKTIYEADATIGDKAYEIKVAEDGTLLKKKIDDDKDEKGDNDEKKD